MLSTFVLIDSKGELRSDAGSIERLKTILSHLDSGRYTVDEISTDPLPSDHTARGWGVMLKLNDGTTVEEPDSWDD
jgi:hypothetical protein